jgi:hypothetical protein
VSEDTSGFKAGMNLYHYVGNHPVNRRDPRGLDYTYNCYNDIKTCPVGGAARLLADCIAFYYYPDFIISGGSEKQGHKARSKHYTNQAIDVLSEGQDKLRFFCIARKCGAQYILDEGNHWHIQTVAGEGGSHGALPSE